MRATAYHRDIVELLDRRIAADRDGLVAGKVGLKVRFGVWVWIGLLGSSLTYEILAFADGPGGQPTLSQLVKGLVRAGGRMGVVACILSLFGAAIVLSLHWGLQIF